MWNYSLDKASGVNEKEFKIAIDGINNIITAEGLSGSGSSSYTYTAYYTSPDGYQGSFQFTIPVGNTSSCSNPTLTPPAYDTSKTYIVGGSLDQYEVPVFTVNPPGCTITYSASASPAAAWITESASSRGMYWYTTDSAEEGNTYTITVTATSGCATSSISYSLSVGSTCSGDTLTIDSAHAVFALLPSVTKSYDIYDPIYDITWTDSNVESALN